MLIETETKDPENIAVKEYEEFFNMYIEGVLRYSFVFQENNFDFERESHLPKEAAKKVHLAALRDFTKFAIQNNNELCDVYNLFADQHSKDLFLQLLLFRSLGHLHVKLPTNNEDYWKERKLCESLKSSPSQMSFKVPDSESTPIQRHQFEFDGKNVTLETHTLSICFAYFHHQYILNRDDISIAPEQGDYVLDLGGWTGDNAICFANKVGVDGKVYCFDFIPAHIRCIENNISLNPHLKDVIEIKDYAVGDKSNDIVSNYQSGKMNVSEKDVVYSAFTFNEKTMFSQFPVRTIDNLVESGEIDRVDFIKTDVEGADLDALIGAEATIRKFKPKLAISIYHTPPHLIAIAKYIDDLNLGYKFYLDHYTIGDAETVLFAQVD